MSWKFKFQYNTRISDTLHEDQYTFLIKSRSVLIEGEMFQTEVEEKIKHTHFIFSNFFVENLAVYEVTWENTVAPNRPQMTIRCMRIACCVTKATNTHSKYVKRIAFHGNNDYTQAPRSYVIGEVPVLGLPATWPWFIAIFKYGCNNQALNYLFCHNLAKPVSRIIIFKEHS